MRIEIHPETEAEKAGPSSRRFFVAAKAGSVLAQTPQGDIIPSGNTMIHTSESLRTFIERAIGFIGAKDVRASGMLRSLADQIAEWGRTAEVAHPADILNLQATIIRLPDNYGAESIQRIIAKEVTAVGVA